LSIDLFTWWAISISWSIAFLIVAGLYLYRSSKKMHRVNSNKVKSEPEIEEPRVTRQASSKSRAINIARNFIFVWILLGLLVFYIFSVKLGTGKFSEVVFALGNILVEILLVFYLFRNKDKTKR